MQETLEMKFPNISSDAMDFMKVGSVLCELFYVVSTADFI
jgi:hypothetical protein